MNPESKLEQAARDYIIPEIFIGYPHQNDENGIKEFNDLKSTFIAGAKSEAAKEYWQSLTTPVSNEVEDEIDMNEVKKLVGTKALDFCIDYHKVNNSCGTLHLSNAYLEGFIECYKMLHTPSKPHTIERPK